MDSPNLLLLKNNTMHNTSSLDLKDVPVVLMSAKGDQVGERFVKVMGIVDYITKPFSPEAITAVVQHTIEKYPRKQPGEAPAVGDVTAPNVTVKVSLSSTMASVLMLTAMVWVSTALAPSLSVTVSVTVNSVGAVML